MNLIEFHFILYELATLFHSYWSKGNEDENINLLKIIKLKIKLLDY